MVCSQTRSTSEFCCFEQKLNHYHTHGPWKNKSETILIFPYFFCEAMLYGNVNCYGLVLKCSPRLTSWMLGCLLMELLGSNGDIRKWVPIPSWAPSLHLFYRHLLDDMISTRSTNQFQWLILNNFNVLFLDISN